MKVKKKYVYLTLAIICILSLFSSHLYMEETPNPKNDNRGKSHVVIKEPTNQKILNDLEFQSPNKKHPRLLANEEDFVRIKKNVNNDTYLKQWYEELFHNANMILNEPVVTYKKSDGIRLLPISRTVLDRLLTLSLMYKISEEPKYADRAWKELESVTNKRKFPDWNPSHFLDTAEMATAVAIGYDWLYNYLNSDQKVMIQNSLIENALNPGLKVYTNNTNQENIPTFWKATTTNWNTVCNSGLVLASLAIADESKRTEEISSTIIKYAISSIQKSLKSYPKDGGTEEGPNYWNYSTKYLALVLSAMDTSLGTNYNLSDLNGLSETGYYPIYMTGYDGVFNIGDGSEKNFDNLSQLLWFSSKYNKPEFAVAALKTYNPLNLIWYKNLTSYSSTFTNLPLDKHFTATKTGIVTMRGSWDNPNSFFVGIHAGDNQSNHGDLDIGTFVLDVLGVRWAGELGAENYSAPGYSDKNGRWLFYRKRTEGQNTLLIDSNKDLNQKKNAKGYIKDFTSSLRDASATIDMTEAYNNAKIVQRKIALINNRSRVVLEDNIKLKRNSDIYWFMHTRAKIRLSNDKKTAILMRRDKKLYVNIKSPSKAFFSIMDAKSLPSSPTNYFQNPNNNIKKLTIHLQEIKKTTIEIEFSIDPYEKTYKTNNK